MKEAARLNSEAKTWVETLIEEYSIGKKALEEYKESLNLDIPEDKEDYKIVSEMISDMQYALDWMKKGRRPGNRRGIDRRSVYQRTSLMDMDIFPEINLQQPKRILSDEEKLKIVDVLMELSARERQCYLMHMAQGKSYAQISAILEISRRTVQQYVERAKKKVKNFAA
ncbi:sigma-70 family RNA polymerase sigma factor [Robertmurraya sp. DFI.2.37]|uniref:sigma-70 family RNA polymerase sigma factor n=1 Tax=Robertmurraya sp. DFI.2.37 TaxID=3031819 RepID=UPI00178385C8|nr:sigma-70 family RNA polymerase sigma factor [Robertmurraya sp. DFI.2.37]MDF1510581.1 sigma-70 family RNA polymerase sigma factor [Robertmurraya sp. DFI.2.37]